MFGIGLLTSHLLEIIIIMDFILMKMKIPRQNILRIGDNDIGDDLVVQRKVQKPLLMTLKN